MIAESSFRSAPRVSSIFVTAVLARGATAALRAVAPGGAVRWERENHAGATVGLYSGAGTALAAAVGAAGVRPAAGFAVLAAGLCGAWDDTAGADDPRRGFRAHLAALRHGEVTTGAVKLLGIGAAGLAAGALLRDRPLDRLLAGIVIAGAAHAVNLVDVRPGRATTAVLALAAPGLLRSGPGASLAAVATAAAAAALPGDAASRDMLGDTGAHALGATLGLAVAASNSRPGLALHAAAVVAAAVYGERVSELARGGRQMG